MTLSAAAAAGAGKTTLMDVLAGRKTSGSTTGDIWVGGYPKDQHTFARVCGYVEQSDIHSPRVRLKGHWSACMCPATHQFGKLVITQALSTSGYLQGVVLIHAAVQYLVYVPK